MYRVVLVMHRVVLVMHIFVREDAHNSCDIQSIASIQYIRHYLIIVYLVPDGLERKRVAWLERQSLPYFIQAR